MRHPFHSVHAISLFPWGIVLWLLVIFGVGTVTYMGKSKLLSVVGLSSTLFPEDICCTVWLLVLWPSLLLEKSYMYSFSYITCSRVPDMSVSTRHFIICTGQLSFGSIDHLIVTTVSENESSISLKLFLLCFLKKEILVYECVACMCVCTPHSRLVAEEVIKGHWIPYNRGYRWLWATMWVLGTEPTYSARATSTLNRWATSLVLHFFFLIAGDWT